MVVVVVVVEVELRWGNFFAELMRDLFLLGNESIILYIIPLAPHNFAFLFKFLSHVCQYPIHAWHCEVEY